MKNQKNNICICGHTKIAHKDLGCVDCFSEEVVNEHICIKYDHKFKIDNLKYLEKCCNEKPAE